MDEPGSSERGISQFVDFVRDASFRFYQERDLGLDLYSTGASGVLLFALVVASLVIFLLALFHAIPVRRTVVALLLGLGTIALSVGILRSFVSYLDLEGTAARLLDHPAGPAPSSLEQLAAVVALPLVLGVATLGANLLGCLYLAVFWGGSLLGSRPRKRNRQTVEA